MTRPKIGLGGEGDLFFSWENSKGAAFLTIDGNELHLLIKPTGIPPIYRDRMRYDAKAIANEIVPALAPFGSMPRSTVSANNPWGVQDVT